MSNTTAQPNPWATKVKVLSIYASKKPGNVKAFATIQIGEALEIHSLKIVQQPGQDAWVSLPQELSNGKHFAVVKAMDDRLMTAITDAVLGEWGTAQ